MFGDQTEKKTGGPQSRKKKESEEEKINNRDEVDFVDEKIHLKMSSCLSSGSLDSAPSSATSSAPSSTSSIRARRNWSVFSERLRETLSKSRKSSTADSLILFDVKCVEISSEDSDCMWIYQRDISSFDSDFDDFDDSHLRIFKFFPPNKPTSLHSLASGFDNTGNVRIWPGSEALAWLILKDSSSILARGNRILELGAGFLGLSSFLIAKKFPETTVWITDGNLESINSLKQIRNANPDFLNRVHVQQLIWGQDQLKTSRFNTILAADCVFFTEHHESLMKCIHSHLAPNGNAVISSPRRKQSLQKFLDYVQNAWSDEFSELKGALQLGVLKTADSVSLRVGGRNGLDLEIKEEVVNQVAAFVWDTVSEDWADDLARFTVHAGRQKINMDDISLLTRRNPELFQAACKLAGVDHHQDAAGQKTGKGRKRKKEEVVSIQHSKLSEDDITVLDDNNALHTPKSYLKKPKLQEEISKGRLTSTPKVAERTLKFPDDITPIRPTDNEVFSSNLVNLSVIEEEKTSLEDKQNEEEEQDSFDVFGSIKGNDSSKTITNMSSLLKRAEEYSSVVESTNDRLENERLERMIPADVEEIDNVSIDSFDNYNVHEEPPVDKSAGTPKNAVFNNKMSSFAFDDEDSFDEPVVIHVSKTTPKNASTSAEKKYNNEVLITKNASNFRGKGIETTPKTSTATKKNKKLQRDHDSFDEFDFDI
ncbi:hypothetical protein GCK72_005787 [Caenorhabditis remanei]|uniref:Calmodulin-lysine N-methyltransferase n=1 Tax=Caenorhabditis remanei TaxID=31234 RepID=A0A6A5HGH7_CAERE|nr:hypothetical protein GCK72_005787 [Caenorhabditis remanei]KAF1765834.1 hypothetical protein GCK72_005787 [Caenorhabditis remanei]